MKFYNYWDDYNLRKYNEIQKRTTESSKTMR